MSGIVTLYDIPTKFDKQVCFSPFVWRIRAALSFKGIPYQVQYVEFPDIKPLFQSLGVRAKRVPEEDYTDYSCPVIRTTDGRYIMDSANIANELEMLYPENSLRVDAPETQMMQDAIFACMSAVSPPVMYRLPERYLNERGVEWYFHERERLFGMSLYDIAKDPKLSGEAAWEKAVPGQKAVAQLLSAHPEGPFVLGADACYADLILASFWKSLISFDQDGDLYDRMMKFDEKFGEHAKACEKWFQRDGH